MTKVTNEQSVQAPRRQKPAAQPGIGAGSHHYQVIILGDSLASRIAGVILAKRGCRILSLQGEPPAGHSWFQPSLHLEQLLESLGGRACFTPPTPFQVLTDNSCLEIHGSSPLEEELRREFPASHDDVLATLENLGSLGEELERILWRCGGLPLFGLGSQAKFSTRRLFSGLTTRGMTRPLSQILTRFAQDPADGVLRALFAGLSMVPPEKLTVAEGALLWSNATRSRGISSSGLDDLLGHRYEQFHGKTGKLAEVKSLEFRGNTLIGATLRNGARCSADHFILGSREALPFLPEKLQGKIPAPSPGWSQISAQLDGTRISPLLAPRVILAGAPPLRLTLTARENLVHCTIDLSRQTGAVDRDMMGEIEQRLSHRIFPFTPYTLQTPSSSGGDSNNRGESGGRRRFLGASTGLRLSGNLFLCHGQEVFPALGATGEVLAGFSTASQIHRRLRTGK